LEPALRVGDDGERSGWDEQNSLLAIRTSMWSGEEQLPKTLSSIRLVDLSTTVNAMLTAYTKALNKNPGDYLFSTRRNTPFDPASLRRLALAPLGVPGFHSCRRWRTSYLRTIGTPEMLLKRWLGHSSGGDVTDRYDKSTDDKEWRRVTANRVGIGFELPTLTIGGPTSEKKLKPAKKPGTRKPEAALAAAPAEPAYVGTDQDLAPMFFEEPTPGRTQEELQAERARLAELRAILEGVS
jgi:hypothetical protein